MLLPNSNLFQIHCLVDLILSKVLYCLLLFCLQFSSHFFSNYESRYVKSGITEWIHNWKKNGWKTTNKKEVSNKELWTELDQLNSEFEISWNWVKAHSTDKLNNEVDLLARDAANL